MFCCILNMPRNAPCSIPPAFLFSTFHFAAPNRSVFLGLLLYWHRRLDLDIRHSRKLSSPSLAGSSLFGSHDPVLELAEKLTPWADMYCEAGTKAQHFG